MPESIHFCRYSPGEGSRNNLMRDCIAGSTFCEKYRIDMNPEPWMEMLSRVKDQYVDSYIQQPFYLINDQYHAFFSCIEKLCDKDLITGILVNSYGMAVQLNKRFKLKLAVSRYAIGKRNNVNSYFIDLMLALNVKAWEIFPYSSEVLQELIPYKNNMEIWIRDTEYRINCFSRRCFLKEIGVMRECDTGNCLDDTWYYKERNKKYNLRISGHILYEEQTQFMNSMPGDYVIIKNHDGVEL